MNNKQQQQNGELKAIVYNDFDGAPLKVTFLNDCWWVTTPCEKFQPLAEYFESNDISFSFLCEAGGKAGALALAKLLGKALENPEDEVGEVLRHRVESLKRLGVTLDVKDESLALEMKTFSNEGKPARQGKYSVACHLHGNYFEQLFDIDAFESEHYAEEWAGYFFDALKDLGLKFSVIKNV